MTSHLRLNSNGKKSSFVFTEDKFENAFFWNSVCAMMILSADGNIIESNDAMCELLGFASSEISRLTINDITYNLDSTRDQEMREDCMTSDRNEYSMEKRYVSKKEKVIWVKSQVQVLRNDDNKIENFIVISIPLPNGGVYKVEKDEKTGEVVVKPVWNVVHIIKEDWKVALGLGLLILWSLFDKLKDNFKMIIDLLH